MRNTPLKQAILFLVGCIINLALFCLSKYLSFPLWLDYTGCFYIAVMCGSVYGGISVVLHTILLTVLIDGSAALWLFLPAAAVCAILILYMKAVQNSVRFSLPEVAAVVIFAAWPMNFLSFISSSQLPGRYFVYNEAFTAICNSHGKFISSLILSAGITLSEITLSLLLLFGLVLITPKGHDGLSFRK